ncbi:hypothetical protein ABIA39_000222 [Nocardia sp. GAS34]
MRIGGSSLFRRGVVTIVAAVLAAAAPGMPSAAAGPVGGGRSVGWDTFRHLDRLPYLDPGAETREYSSFDRSGGDFDPLTGNNNGSGGCLGPGGAGCVIAQDDGAGEIESVWFTRDGGVVSAMGNLRVELDGRTVVDAPLQTIVDGGLGAPFVFPLVANGNQSSGGVYIKVPMPYRRSMRISVTSQLQYYHVVYRHFPDSDGVTAFDPADRAQDVIATMRSAGARDPKPEAPDTRHDRRTVNLSPGAAIPIAAASGSGSIAALRLRIAPAARAGLRLRIAFDDRVLVDAPVDEFFGAGFAAPPVRALMFAGDPAPGGRLSAWWPMPYARNATAWLVNGSLAPVSGVDTDVATVPDPRWAAALASGRAGYFTAHSHTGLTAPGQDWMFADQPGRGKFVGVSETMRGVTAPSMFSPDAPLFLEGAERVYVDGAGSPRLYGTGTEDFFEGGWYFKAHVDKYPGSLPDHNPVGGVAFSDPLTGMPAAGGTGPGCASYCLDAYRLMLTDAVDYRSGLRFGIEHGKRNLMPADYGSTAFLYTSASPAAAPGDRIDLADRNSRAAHAYSDPGAVRYPLVSQYEGTADTVPVPGTVCATSAPITFRTAIPPGNTGVVLERTGDQDRAYQSARVLVDGTPIGTWLQPRRNTIHRWLDDTYVLPAAATANKRVLTITLEPTPGSPPWTASRYRVAPLLGP